MSLLRLDNHRVHVKSSIHYLKYLYLVYASLLPCIFLVHARIGFGLKTALAISLLKLFTTFILTRVGIYVLRKFEWYNYPKRFVFKMTFLLCFVAVLIHNLIDIPLFLYLPHPIYFERLVYYLVTCGLHFGLIFCSIFAYFYFYLIELYELEKRIRIRADILVKNIQRKHLNSQINPHFLFNALSVLSDKSFDCPKSIDVSIKAISDYLRFNLSLNNERVSFGKEWDAVVGYLAIQSERFGSRLQVVTHIDHVCKPILIHSPIILELVENAIKYGFETTQGIVVITVTAVVEGSVFKIIVENSGHWVKPSQRIKQSTQLGLTNLTDRLRLAYEDKASLSFEQSSTSVSALVLIHIE